MVSITLTMGDSGGVGRCGGSSQLMYLKRFFIRKKLL